MQFKSEWEDGNFTEEKQLNFKIGPYKQGKKIQRGGGVAVNTVTSDSAVNQPTEQL